MSLWLQTSGKLYLPPSKPVAHVLNTDDYVIGTDLYFHAGTDRLLIVGHPYFDVMDSAVPTKITVPKVSGNQYRVMRVLFPDPNKFALADKSLFNPERERLVWKVVGLEIGRGGPLGIGGTGHPLFNKYFDNENPSQYPPKRDDEEDYRQDIAMDPKQVQLFIVGCSPATGEHWDIADVCPGTVPDTGSCPPIQLVQSVIEDGDMCETGFGAVNFKTFQQDKAGVPLDLTGEIAKWPDLLKMSKDTYGDQMFFYGKKEQLYARHFMSKAGVDGDAVPESLYLTPQNGKPQHDLGPHNYFITPSGSLVSSDSNMFNRPYWIHKAQGANNGILWGNQMFITIVDNTRNTNFALSIYKENEAMSEEYRYKSGHFRNYLRHVEEYELEVILQLCKVPLDAEILSHINVMNPKILEDWELSFVPPAPSGIEDTYRYIKSLATKCPTQAVASEKEDPYDKYTFWVIDLTEKLSSELSQFSLGKRFLYQTGMLNGKRSRSTSVTRVNSRTKKRKRT